MTFSPERDTSYPVNENSLQESHESPALIEYVPRFEHIKEDLLYLFDIEATSEASLSYPWEKDKFYGAALKELQLGTPFALDYFFDEQLLKKEDITLSRRQEMRPYAETILRTFKGPRLVRAKELFAAAGILTTEESGDILYAV